MQTDGRVTLQVLGPQPFSKSQQLVRYFVALARSAETLVLPVNLHQRALLKADTQPRLVSAAQRASEVCHQCLKGLLVLSVWGLASVVPFIKCFQGLEPVRLRPM
jgi:hypothetical protein